MPQRTDKVYTGLAEIVIRRYRSHDRKSLKDVYQVDRHFLKLDPRELEFAFTNREGILAVLRDPQLLGGLVKLFVDSSLDFTYRSNQFIHMDQAEQAVLERLYRAYLLGFLDVVEAGTSLEKLESGLADLVAGHFQDLKDNLARFFDDGIAPAIQDNIILRRAVCSEYSAQFQLELLGVSLQTLVQPVLDLGCGKSGYLVNYLNGVGIQAVGVDRIVEPAGELTPADWLEMDLVPGSWGAIVSHMAFSNHFLFHHRYRNGHPQKYARRYIQLLDALKPGGSFYYAPGLPFIEQFLPADRFSVTRREIEPALFPRLSSNSQFDESVWYAAQVTRKQ